MKVKKFIIECTEEQLDDLKSVIDYVLNTEEDHFYEFREEYDEDTPHVYAMACNASNIEYKEVV